uniref:Cytosolic Fe-S cluster assembly factor NUBP2-like n=1 Tax=Podarcis muralis TaxID=64176 RepID=A0A670I8T9_PODMU
MEEAAEDGGNLAGVQHIIVVLSGKGGVGKSTISTELALALHHTGKKVGILDVDLCGPSIPRMLNVQDRDVHQCNGGWVPVFVGQDKSIAVMSIGFLLEKPDDAVIWRGPKKNGCFRGGREARADLLQEDRLTGPWDRGEHERLRLPTLFGMHQCLFQRRWTGAGQACRGPIPRVRAPGPPAQPELGTRQRLPPGISQEPGVPCARRHRPADLGWGVRLQLLNRKHRLESTGTQHLPRCTKRSERSCPGNGAAFEKAQQGRGRLFGKRRTQRDWIWAEHSALSAAAFAFRMSDCSVCFGVVHPLVGLFVFSPLFSFSKARISTRWCFCSLAQAGQMRSLHTPKEQRSTSRTLAL